MEFREARKYCDANGLTFVPALIKTEKELESGVKTLCDGKVDMIVVTSSGKIYDNTDKISKIAYAKKIPVYSYNKKAVAKGAIASLSIGYEDLILKHLVPMMKRVLKDNINPGKIPVGFAEDFGVFINNTQAKQIDLVIPDEIIKKSKEVL